MLGAEQQASVQDRAPRGSGSAAAQALRVPPVRQAPARPPRAVPRSRQARPPLRQPRLRFLRACGGARTAARPVRRPALPRAASTTANCANPLRARASPATGRLRPMAPAPVRPRARVGPPASAQESSRVPGLVRPLAPLRESAEESAALVGPRPVLAQASPSAAGAPSGAGSASAWAHFPDPTGSLPTARPLAVSHCCRAAASREAAPVLAPHPARRRPKAGEERWLQRWREWSCVPPTPIRARAASTHQASVRRTVAMLRQAERRLPLGIEPSPHPTFAIP